MISKDSDKIQVVLKKVEIEKIRDMAQKENRSISNMAAVLLRKVLKK